MQYAGNATHLTDDSNCTTNTASFLDTKINTALVGMDRVGFMWPMVWAGRKRGVFYRWCDVAASVAGFTGAKFKGFDSRRAAETAFAAGFS